MTKVLRSRASILEALDAHVSECNRSLLGMYNSRLGGIIQDPSLMSVSIDDHMVHRGHSVFDTLTVVDGNAYNMPRHLRRLLNSAGLARIDLPFPVETVQKVLLDLCASTGKPNLYVRYWMSAGPGSMAVWPQPGQSSFYAVVYDSDVRKKLGIVNEATVSVPVKGRFLATMKSTNYLVNALTAMEAREKGGHLGLQVDENGFIAEGSVNNVFFILPNMRFVTPRFDNILNGTSIEVAIDAARRLVEKGELEGVEQRDIHISEAKTAVEMMISTGDAVSTVVNWDGVPVGDGTEGKFAKYFKEMMLQEYLNPDKLIPVDYSLYLPERQETQ